MSLYFASLPSLLLSFRHHDIFVVILLFIIVLIIIIVIIIIIFVIVASSSPSPFCRNVLGQVRLLSNVLIAIMNADHCDDGGSDRPCANALSAFRRKKA